MPPFIQCHQIVKAYKVSDHEIVALRGIDFEMEKGEMVAIIGPSGAGKSSLLNLLGGLDTPTAGQLIVDGKNLLELKGRQVSEYRLREVGFLWQQVDRNLLSHRSAIRNVTLPMMLADVPLWRRRRKARQLLDAVGLGDQVHKKPHQLSGGQQQRVAIGVALANNPPLLLADEPTGALDRKTSDTVMALLQELREDFGLTILMTTHDLEVANHADRILTLRDGALGQDISDDSGEDHLKFDDGGRIRLPDRVRTHLTEGDRVAVEIRPEGILLRAERDEDDNVDDALQDMLPQDAAPSARRGLLSRLFRRNRNKKGSK